MATYTPYTPNYNRMQAAVSAAQKQRAAVAGPPSPMMTSGVDMSEGVEQRARAMREMAGPQQPQMVNGVQRYNAPAAAQAPAAAPAQPMMPAAQPQQAAAPMMTAAPAQAQAPVNPLGGMDSRSLSSRGAQPTTGTPTPAQAMPTQAAPAQPGQAQAPVNPLGGMDSRSLSARGGPMGYSQQGVGTNNPNSYAVGQKRAPLGMRLLERQARRRDPRAIGQLASMEQQNSQNAAQMSMAQMREAGDAQRFGQQQQQQMTMFQQQQVGMQQRDATGFDQQKQILAMQGEQRANESAQEFQRRQQAASAERAAGSVVGAEAMQVPGGGFVPMVKKADGSMGMAGSYQKQPTSEMMSPPNIAAHIAEMQTQGIQATYGKSGFNYAPAKASKEDYHISSIPGPMITDPITRKQMAGPDIPVRVNKKTGQYTRLTEEQAANQPGAAAAAPDKPGWASWLDQQTQTN